mgnify:CR=1 FL=1
MRGCTYNSLEKKTWLDIMCLGIRWRTCRITRLATRPAPRTPAAAGLLALLGQAVGSYGASLHGQVAAIYLEATQAQVPAGLSCASVEQFLRPQQSLFNQVWDYGFDNPEHHIGDLCS